MMELIKASLMSAVMQAGTITITLCDEIKAMPICANGSFGNKYDFYLKHGVVSSQAKEVIQQVTHTSLDYFYPYVLTKPNYFYLCVYPYGANPSVDDFYEAIVCPSFVNNSYLYEVIYNSPTQDNTGCYMFEYRRPNGYGGSITVNANTSQLHLNCAISLNGAWTREQYAEDGTVIYNTGTMFSATQSIDVANSVSGTGYESYTKLTEAQYRQYCIDVAETVYNI